MSTNSPDHAHEPPTDVEYPSTLRITSKPFEDHKENALDRAERWEQGETVPHVVNFQDASRLQRILTPRRLELVRSLMDAPAESMRDLADPAAVVRFELDGERCCVAADGGSRVKDNLRAIEHYLESQRSAHAESVPPQVCQTVRANIDRPY